MKLSAFRLTYPEYNDLPDEEVSQLLPPEEEAPLCAPGIEAALSDISGQLSALVKQLQKEKPLKFPELPDNSAAILGLAKQLQDITAAITNFKMPTPVKSELPPRPTAFKIKRDEIGNIESVIPQYK